jgi:hypothetical protein
MTTMKRWIVPIILTILFFFNLQKSQAQVNIINTSSHPISDVVYAASLTLEIDSVIIFIKDFPKKTIIKKTNHYNILVKSFVIDEGNNAYTIYLGQKLNNKTLHANIIEEVCHIYQYNKNLLSRIDRYNVLYKEKVINLYSTPYHRRLFEFDAKVMTKKIMKDNSYMNKIHLYNIQEHKEKQPEPAITFIQP